MYFINRKLRNFCLQNYVTIILKLKKNNKISKEYFIISNKPFINNGLNNEQILYLSSINFYDSYNKDDDNIKKDPGRSIIHLLVRNNKLDIMKSLINQFPKLNVNIGTIIDNWHPLNNAIYFDHKEMIDLLISQGVSKDWNMSYSKIYNFNNFKDFNYFINNIDNLYARFESRLDVRESTHFNSDNIKNDIYVPYNIKYNNIIMEHIDNLSKKMLYYLYNFIKNNIFIIQNIEII